MIISFKHVLKILLVILSLHLFLYPTAQEIRINKEALSLIDSANAAFCKSDTLQAMAILESIETKFRGDGLLMATSVALGELYLKMGNTLPAKGKLFMGLSNIEARYVMPAALRDSCKKLVGLNYWQARARLCLALSQVYCKEKQFDSSLYYLNLASGRYFPEHGCGNAIFMYQSEQSLYFADHYLAAGDTATAIVCLLDQLVNTDGNTRLIGERLKPVLLQKYSQKEIDKELYKGIRTCQVFDTGDKGYAYLTLFGHTSRHEFSDKKFFKKVCNRCEGMRVLLNKL